MLRIALVADRTHLTKQRALARPRHITALADALAETGHDVTLYAEHGADVPWADGAPRRRVVPLPKVREAETPATRPTARTTPPLAAALAETRPDVVHTHGGPAGLVAAHAAAALGIPVVHSVSFDEHGSSFPADRFIATCTAQLKDLISNGVPRQRIDVVPLGVDTDTLTPDGPAAPRVLRHRLVAVGRISPDAGFGTIIATLQALPGTELVIAGGPANGTHARQLRRYAHELGVADRVRLAGPVDQLDLPGLLRSADVAVCTPWDVTSDLAAVEAMACGVAVVASTVGALSDAVVDKVTGTLVPPRKPRALAVALRRLLTHRAMCEQYGAAGRDRAWARYSWTRIATETVHSYRRAGAIDPVDSVQPTEETAPAL
jgi:glycosyltransferase involved in cell wall biosynthesis